MFKYGIIVIGYRNSDGIKRLLKTLNGVNYCQDEVTLIIGIDHSEELTVKNLAEEYEWRYGKKIIRFQTKHLGLKRHILTCGNYLNEYNLDAVAIFEDDVIPSRGFYQYMKAATERYYYEYDIAGISLYLPNNNVNAEKPFQAILNGQDAFFLQYPQSWGQVWMRNQWNDFYEWYKKNEEWEDGNPGWPKELPQNVMSWGEESWLKYHIKYCITKNKYFVYPYVSFSTCFSEKGVHTAESSNRLQVAMQNGKKILFDFPNWQEESVCYDVFYENVNLFKYIGISKDDLTIDLYGMHMITGKRYLLTCRELPYMCIRTWGKKLIPHDMNIICDIQGNDIFLYDLGMRQAEITGLPVYKQKNKTVENLKILDRLLLCKEQGIKLDYKLLSRGIKSVAIYGCGIVGRHLAEELKYTKVEIKCFIDQYVLEKDAVQIRVIRWEDELPEIDAIIITPTYDYEKICHMLRRTYCGEIISIWDLINEENS